MSIFKIVTAAKYKIVNSSKCLVFDDDVNKRCQMVSV